MIGPAKIYFLLFGVLTIVGGVIGYVSKGSMPSLIAGGIAGALLLVAALLLPAQLLPGLILALVVSLLLAGRFLPIFLKNGGVMPAGMMSVLSIIGVLIAIAALVKR